MVKRFDDDEFVVEGLIAAELEVIEDKLKLLPSVQQMTCVKERLRCTKTGALRVKLKLHYHDDCPVLLVFP